MNLTTAHEFIGIQYQPRGTVVKHADFSLLTSTPERMLVGTFSTLPMGGGIFWSVIPFFLFIEHCRTQNDVSAGQWGGVILFI